MVRTGEAELLPDVPDALLRTAAIDDEQLEILRKVGLRSAMVVPLRARGRMLGDIAPASAESGRRFGEADLAMAQQLADRCALALDNARLFAERRYAAKTLQEGLLPAALPDIPRVELAVQYRAGTLGTDVGGDFSTSSRPGTPGSSSRATSSARARRRRRSPASPPHPARGGAVRALAGPRRCACSTARCSTSSPTRSSSAPSPWPPGRRAAPCHVRRTSAAARPPSRRQRARRRPARRPDRRARRPVRVRRGAHAGGRRHGRPLHRRITDAHGADGHFGHKRLAAVLAMLVGLPPPQIVERIDRAVAAYRTGEPTDDSAVVGLRPGPDGP